MMLRSVSRLIHWGRDLVKGWSADKDQAFHDSLFARQRENSFTFAYTGYVTICRFADLVSPYLTKATMALDLGCGCGEITCELAKRFPTVRFLGVDHSERGIQRAREHSEHLQLTNAAFEIADVEQFEPVEAVDIIMMFDAFHHLSDPDRFVKRMLMRTSRFILIEPRGDWKGTWRKDLEMDWLITELEKIRARMAYMTGEHENQTADTLPSIPPPHNEAIEHRYSYEDFESFFEGLSLTVRGTVAGLEIYPPDPYWPSPSRERFGHLAYDLLKETDGLLYDCNLDLFAKHWVVSAERDGPRLRRRSPPDDHQQQLPPPQLVQGPYDVEYLSYEGPRTAAPGEEISAILCIRNRGWKVWSSHVNQNPVHISYHWLDRKGRMLVEDGKRNLLPRAIGPNEECIVEMRIVTLDHSGRIILAIDLVHEGVTWFSQAGSPCHRIEFRVI